MSTLLSALHDLRLPAVGYGLVVRGHTLHDKFYGAGRPTESQEGSLGRIG